MAWTVKQREYWHRANRRWNLKGGATRSGKTYLDYYLMPRRIRAVAGLDGHIVLLGNSQGTLQRNVIEPMQRIWGTGLVSDIRTSDNTAKLFGTRVYCLGAGKKSQTNIIRGSSIKYCYGDEVVTWHEEVFQMLKTRLDQEYSLFDGTYNPDNPGHWLKEFIDGDADIFHQQYSVYDNTFLSPKVLAEMELENVGVYHSRYILGQWTQAEGLIFPNFMACVVPTGDRPYTEFQLSIDYGTENPFAAGLYGLCGDTWYKVKEYHYSGKKTNRPKTDGDYLKDLQEFTAGINLSEIIIDPSAASFRALLEQQGYYVRKAKNEVVNGLRLTNTAMQQGKIKVNDCCVESIKEAGTYSWDTKAGKDKVIEENDHHCDEFRYFCVTNNLVDGQIKLIGQR